MSAGVRDLPTEAAPIGIFARYLSVWVLACIVLGIALGHAFPGFFALIASVTYAHVNLPVAALVWVMILPMLTSIDMTRLAGVSAHWRGVGVTVAINWLIKPFSMALIAWIFLRHLFAAWLPPSQIASYVAGLILLAAAPCTAMVFVWSDLAGGDPRFTLSQVALNDSIMVFAFAPIVGVLLGLSAIIVPWQTLLLSVLLYVIVPGVIAQALRARMLRRGQQALSRLSARLRPASLLALLATLVLLFGFQGQEIVREPLVILLLAVPILVQTYLNATLAYVLNRRLCVAHCIAAPSALIGASNFFELAVATAVALFGLKSGAALATVVGVLVEVPVMLSVVYAVRVTRSWYESGLSR